MSDTKTKIVLDSNILIHFIKAERLSMLSQIYKGYKFVILSKVLDLEFKYPNSFRKIIERHVHLLHDIDIIDWQPSTEEEINDFAELREKHGPGIYSISLPELMDKRFLTISSNIKGLIKSLEIIEVLSNPTWVNTNGETSCIFDCNCGIEIDERNYMFS